MSTYRDITYMVLDKLKLTSDDSYFEEEHVVYLIDKYREILLKQRYSDVRREIPEVNMQELDLSLIVVPAIAGETCETGTYLKSEQKVPHIISLNGNYNVTKVYATDYWKGEFAVVSRERFKYVGTNRFLYNSVYCAIGPDNYAYFKSANPNYLDIAGVKLIALFATPKDLFVESPSIDDFMDMEYPLEESLIGALLEMVVADLTKAVNKPEDSHNNAKDDLNN
jgi:hypothetical protein